MSTSTVGRDDEWDVLAEYSRTDGRREWVSLGTWLLPGDAVVQISVADLDSLRAENEALVKAAKAVLADEPDALERLLAALPD